MARTTIYVDDYLYRWWRFEAPELVLSDFVRQGLSAEFERRRQAGTHQVRTSATGTK